MKKLSCFLLLGIIFVACQLNGSEDAIFQNKYSNTSISDYSAAVATINDYTVTGSTEDGKIFEFIITNGTPGIGHINFNFKDSEGNALNLSNVVSVTLNGATVKNQTVAGEGKGNDCFAVSDPNTIKLEGQPIKFVSVNTIVIELDKPSSGGTVFLKSGGKGQSGGGCFGPYGFSWYSEVQIGQQIWMAENLNVDKFRNGDPIPHAETIEEWTKAGEEGKPAWCYYDNDPANAAKYGKLYNWYAITDSRNICPIGWHLPSYDEWTTLINYLGGNQIAGMKLKSEEGWDDGGNGTNESGFTGYPGGHRYINGDFYEMGQVGSWWSSNSDINYGTGLTLWEDSNMALIQTKFKPAGHAVRCVKD